MLSILFHFAFIALFNGLGKGVKIVSQNGGLTQTCCDFFLKNQNLLFYSVLYVVKLKARRGKVYPLLKMAIYFVFCGVMCKRLLF